MTLRPAQVFARWGVAAVTDKAQIFHWICEQIESAKGAPSTCHLCPKQYLNIDMIHYPNNNMGLETVFFCSISIN